MIEIMSNEARLRLFDSLSTHSFKKQSSTSVHFIAILITFLPSYLLSEPPNPYFLYVITMTSFLTNIKLSHLLVLTLCTIAIVFTLATIIKVVTIQLHKLACESKQSR